MKNCPFLFWSAYVRFCAFVCVCVCVRACVCVLAWTELWGTRYLVHLHCRDFSLFSIFFSSRTQKPRKRKTNNFHRLKIFMRALIVGFGLWRVFVFLCAKSFCKKKKSLNCPNNLIYITTQTPLLHFQEVKARNSRVTFRMKYRKSWIMRMTQKGKR